MSQSLEFKIPEGYVFDKDNSTDEVIRFKPIKKKITYEDIVQELKAKNIGICIRHGLTTIGSELFITNEKQLEQLLALNKLMNVAKYLNGDWEPNWNDEYENKFYIYCLFEKLSICSKHRSNHGGIEFKSKELARQAIEILGEDEVKKALGIFE